jgi:membrane fusion protein, multidrug efflux system
LQGDVIQISSKVAGTVQELGVADNQRVEAGQLLVRLDPTDFQIAAAQAQAALELTQRQSDTAQTSIGYSAAQSGAQTTQAQGTTSLANTAIAIAEAGVATAEDNIAASQAKLAQAQAQFEQAARDLSRMQALAAEGRHTKPETRPGRDGVQSGAGRRGIGEAGCLRAAVQVGASQAGREVRPGAA